MAKLKITGAKWTPSVNYLRIHCTFCGAQFDHRADRWNVVCPSCGVRDHLSDMRDRIKPGDIKK